jgi:hypothetical protein
MTETVTTYHGAFELIHSVTLGECLIAAAVFLHLAFSVVRWMLDNVWRKG